MTKLIKIGNSKGIRIPKAIIEKANLEDKNIDIIIQDDGILLKPIDKNPRANWDKMIEEELKSNKSDDELLDFDLDTKEWQW